jgi:hypothetical protein
MLLVVAAAAGFWLNRIDGLSFEFFWTSSAYDRIELILRLLLSYFAAGTTAFVGMRIRQPRLAIRRLTRQPGAVACIVASAVLLVVGWVASTMAMGYLVEFSQFITPMPFRGGGHGQGGTFVSPGENVCRLRRSCRIRRGRCMALPVAIGVLASGADVGRPAWSLPRMALAGLDRGTLGTFFPPLSFPGRRSSQQVPASRLDRG